MTWRLEGGNIHVLGNTKLIPQCILAGAKWGSEWRAHSFARLTQAECAVYFLGKPVFFLPCRGPGLAITGDQ